MSLSRDVLTDRFWDGSPNRRASLGMALDSLRRAFGVGCLIRGRGVVRAAARWFSTDLSQVLCLHALAVACPMPQERLQLLGDAAALIRGEFLEGGLARSGHAGESVEADEGDFWY